MSPKRKSKKLKDEEVLIKYIKTRNVLTRQKGRYLRECPTGRNLGGLQWDCKAEKNKLFLNEKYKWR